MSAYNYEVIEVEDVGDHVLHVKLNRPRKMNALNDTMWRELFACFTQIAAEASCRAVVVSGNGKMFSAGLDFHGNPGFLGPSKTRDVGRRALQLKAEVTKAQEAFNIMERCPQPVLAAVHGACIGGALGLLSACDIRYCSEDAWFTIKEVDIGLAADVGPLQRFPKTLGNEGLVKELAYTARRFEAAEAHKMGLITRVYTKDALIPETVKLAKFIASKSPLAVTGTKVNLNYARDHTVTEGLAHVALWNAAMVQSGDVPKAAQASFQKKNAVFAKL